MSKCEIYVVFVLYFILNISFAEPNQNDLAEYDRLSGEMEKMSKHNVWKGVDKRFEEMESLEVEISFDNYLLGPILGHTRCF